MIEAFQRLSPYEIETLEEAIAVLIAYIIAIAINIGIYYIAYRLIKRLIRYGINYYFTQKIVYDQQQEIDRIAQDIHDHKDTFTDAKSHAGTPKGPAE